ncbi:MAG: type II toxin-antitoxin system HicA family toxin [bacterium]|nr:type II toxin-antitoxin system HicA family toxin [bacterium]
MKRVDFERHLRVHGCRLIREGAKHSVYHKSGNNLTSTLPRHSEIFPSLVRKICKDLDITAPRGR